MNPIARAARAILGLFFDDGKLALEVLALLACSALVANAELVQSWYSITLLVAGTLILLLENVVRTARTVTRSSPGPSRSRAVSDAALKRTGGRDDRITML
jgi:hypothetical protein